MGAAFFPADAASTGFAGKVKLTYIDPPFDTGADFSFTATIPDHPDTEEDEATSFVKQPSIIEQKAYRDTWGRGLDSYLQWFYETAVLLRNLLAEEGNICAHRDSPAKAVLLANGNSRILPALEEKLPWQKSTISAAKSLWVI